MIKTIFLIAFVFFATTAKAQDIRFDQITQSDLDLIAKELSANFAHTTVSGASSLGKIFGFQVGLMGAYTKTPEIDRFVKRVDSTQTVDRVYNAALIGQLTVPFGLTGEASFFPSVGSDKFKFSNLGLGVKWTITQELVELPVDIALKLNYTFTNLSFKQTINNSSTGNVPVESTIDYKNSIFAYGAFVSKSFEIVEPYIGFCFLSSRADLGVSGTGTIFDSSFTTAQSASSSPSGTLFTLGAEVSLAFFRLGAEYGSLFGTSRYVGKLAASF